MVERITDPHKPVQIHGYGRLADGQIVRQPPAPPLPSRQLTPGLIVAGIVLALMVAGIAGVTW